MIPAPGSKMGSQSESEIISWKKEQAPLLIAASHNEQQLMDSATGTNSPSIKDQTLSDRHNFLSRSSHTCTPLFVYVISFFSIIGGFLFGYDTGVIAGALLELEKDFTLDVTKKELIVSVTVVGAALGALCGGPVNEKLGRKPTIMIASIIFAVGALMMGVVPTGEGIEKWSWLIVLAGRLIVGLGIGKMIYSSHFSIILELSRAHTLCALCT